MKRAASLVLVLALSVAASTPAFAKKNNYQQQLMLQQQMMMQQQASQGLTGEAAAEEAARQAYTIQAQNSAAAMAQWNANRANANSAYAVARAHGFRGYPYSAWNNVNNETTRQRKIASLRQQIGSTMDSGQRAALIQQLKYLEHHRF